MRDQIGEAPGPVRRDQLAPVAPPSGHHDAFLCPCHGDVQQTVSFVLQGGFPFPEERTQPIRDVFRMGSPMRAGIAEPGPAAPPTMTPTAAAK